MLHSHSVISSKVLLIVQSYYNDQLLTTRFNLMRIITTTLDCSQLCCSQFRYPHHYLILRVRLNKKHCEQICLVSRDTSSRKLKEGAYLSWTDLFIRRLANYPALFFTSIQQLLKIETNGSDTKNSCCIVSIATNSLIFQKESLY